MFTYGLDGPIETRDKPTTELRRPIKPEGSKYRVLSFSRADCDITWCVGPGISTIFVRKNGSPYDLCVLSRRFSA